MKKTLAAIALALTLPAGIAFAEPQNVVPPAQQQALQPGPQQCRHHQANRTQDALPERIS